MASATTGSHHWALPSRIRCGISTAEAGGTYDSTVCGVPLRNADPKKIASSSIVIGVDVDCRSSVRLASAPVTAHRQAMSRNPTRKKARNQPSAPLTVGSSAPNEVKLRPDQADRGVEGHLRHGQRGVAQHLAGEQLAHRDLGRDDLDDARLLLLDHAAREGLAEGERGHVEEERQRERHALGEVALLGVTLEHVRGQLRAAR